MTARNALSSGIRPPTNVDNKLAVILTARHNDTVLVLMEPADFTAPDHAGHWKFPQTNLPEGYWLPNMARHLMYMRYELKQPDTEIINVSHLPFRDDLPPGHATRKGFGATDTYFVILQLRGRTSLINRPEAMAKWTPRELVPSICQPYRRTTYVNGLNAIPGTAVLFANAPS